MRYVKKDGRDSNACNGLQALIRMHEIMSHQAGPQFEYIIFVELEEIHGLNIDLAKNTKRIYNGVHPPKFFSQ